MNLPITLDDSTSPVAQGASMTDSIRVAAEQARVAPMQGLADYLRAQASAMGSSFLSAKDAPHAVIAALRGWADEVEAALAALPGDTSKEQALDLIGELEAVRTINAPEGYILASGLHTLRRYIEQTHSAATPAVESSQIAGRDGASDAPILTDAQITKIIEHADGSEFSDYEFARAIEAALLAHLALTSPGLPSASPLPSLSETDDSALPQGGVGGPTYYVRHPDDSYTVADPQPASAAPK